MKLKNLLLFVIVVLVASACNVSKTCPTYSKAPANTQDVVLVKN